MKVTAMLFLFLIQGTVLTGQNKINPMDVITEVCKAQTAVKSVDYSIERRDTLVTGDIRSMKGSVKISVDKSDTILGFHFWAKKINENTEKIYDGLACYETNINSNTYRFWNSTSVLQNLLYSGGGHLVVPDLIKLDTSKNNGITLLENKNSYDIIISYPDLTEYNVIKREKIVTIDKTNMLPVAVRQHQETYGKVQDLYFYITTITISPGSPYNFAALPFLKAYTYLAPEPVASKPALQQGMPAPYFSLESFDGKAISSNDFKGKVMLLDFWEIWCGPCIEAMPKIMALYDNYHSRGLEIFGITNDLKQLSSARAFSERKQINFPLLIGNEQVKKDYRSEAVPLYVLIDRKGIIWMVSLGYTDELEKKIAEALDQV